MTDIPDLTIIIVNWNVKELLRDCLESIYSQTQEITFEIVIVDNGSSDGSVEMVGKEFPEVKLITNKENLGFAKANNQAMRESKGRNITLLNTDTVILGGALVTMVRFMDAYKEVGAVGPKILNPDKTIQLPCGRHSPTLLTELWDFTKLSSLFPRSQIFGRALMSYWPHDDTREVELISGACMMVRKDTIEQIGLMDEHFFLYGDETDWCYRMRKNGWKIYLHADAEVIHLGQRSMKRNSVITVYWSCKSMCLFFLKHHGRLSALTYRAMVFIFIGVRIPVYWLLQYFRPSNRFQIQGVLKQYLRILRWSIRPNE